MQEQLKQINRCAICNEIITKEDLVHIADGLRVHFRCYIEIQEKICSICGKPFKNQEEVFFCLEHKEYFHTTEPCLSNHLEKHMPFKRARYDATKNRITLIDID